MARIEIDQLKRVEKEIEQQEIATLYTCITWD